MFGLITIGLLMFQTGWQVTNTFQDRFFPDIWPFQVDVLWQSSTWFYALIQVVFSTQIGVGAIPVVTGKFLYKGDAVRTCVVYMCFNFLVTIVATAYYMTTFGQHNISSSASIPFPDLTTITSIYDRAFVEEDHSYLRSLIPSLAYLMVIVSGLTSVAIAIYTSSRLLKRHPNYIMCLVAMFVAIAALICPKFNVSRYLDLRLVGTVVLCALVFDIISITWVYGAKNLSNDLEFSIGRPIKAFWLVLWSLVPLILIGLVAWWIALPSRLFFDPVVDVIPRWIPVVVCAAVIVMFAGYEVSKQVDYNMCNMIQESTRPAKDWGPADPLVRHAWKQWKTVCDDTGQRDFTLRRRGTKDWTSSIKKGQYSHASRNQSVASGHKYIVNGKHTGSTFTGGSNSPNYSGSVFGDSAIEEDMNSDKYPSNQLDPYSTHESRSRKSSTKRSSDSSQRSNYLYHQHNLENGHDDEPTVTADSNYHSQKIPIRVSNGRRHENFTSRIEVLGHDTPPPPAQFQAYQSTFMSKNPLGHHIPDVNFSGPFNDKFGHHLFQQDFNNHQSARIGGHLINNIRISDCSDGSGTLSTKTTNTATTHGQEPYNWRKTSRNMDEFSTEL
jgi:solute carrier family 6 (neurotransmitter transporter), invertebrate